jgi:predicted Zn-dependent protease
MALTGSPKHAHTLRTHALRGLRMALWSVAFWPVAVAAHGTFDAQLGLVNEQLAVRAEDPALYFKRAEIYCEHEQPQEALADLARVDSIDPSALPVDYLRGMCLRLAGRPAEALVALDHYLEANPENSAGHLQRARVRSALGNEQASLDDYRAALAFAKRPEPDLIQEASGALAKNGFAEDALKVLDDGLAHLGPIPSLTLRALDLETTTGRFDAALARVDLLQKAAPRPEPWMAKRAALLAQAGRIDEARAAWTALGDRIAALPNLERGSTSMSTLAEQARHALAALDSPEAKAAAATTPILSSPAKTYVPTAPLFPSRSSLGEGSRYEEELDRVDRQILKAPADAGLRFQRAYLLLLDGKTDEAYADCDEADRLSPRRFPTDRIRGQLLTAQGKFPEAKTLLDAYLHDRPDDALALAARARLLMKSNQASAALVDYRAALANTPDPESNFYQEVAAALGENGRRAEALQVLSAGLKKYAGLPSLVAQTLEMEIATGDFEAALSRVDALQKTAPRPEPWMARRALLLAQAGRRDESRAAWAILRDRIAALPNLERGSPSFRALAEQAGQALAAR